MELNRRRPRRGGGHTSYIRQYAKSSNLMFSHIVYTVQLIFIYLQVTDRLTITRGGVVRRSLRVNRVANGKTSRQRD